MSEQPPPGFWNDIVPTVDVERCQRCKVCPPVDACLAQAFRREDPDGLPCPDQDLCFGCYSCAATCLYGAVLLPRPGA